MKELPDKLYYSISEVASFAGVKAHVLRYWESEFPSLKPKKNRAGNRSYRKRDVEEVLAIKRLLYEEGYKIDGARRILRDRGAHVEQLELIQPAAASAQAAPATAKGASRKQKVAALKKDLSELIDFVRDF